MATSIEALPPITSASWDVVDVPDGYQAEIIGGELVVTPGPGFAHRVVQTELLTVLQPQVPGEWRIVFEPEWRLERGGAVAMAPQPDLLVVHRGDHLERVPLLAVEVLSPADGRRLVDGRTRREAKMADYAGAGLLDYLEVVPEPLTVIRYEAVGGRFVEVERVGPGETLATMRPFEYTIDIDDLRS